MGVRAGHASCFSQMIMEGVPAFWGEWANRASVQAQGKAWLGAFPCFFVRICRVRALFAPMR
ncbi:hypothetical protein ASY01nite_08520 [Acetobacter syzygii]|nr:hypothetical protein Absy_009_165 [Acetobacter syzygii]GBR62649.1 hypothetical protein AA0483_0473 [Acetobacter syzygii NRIC 0483]GEL55786.1 hypothetical protein ASY01nite_08520 [Acetobacter syzygii]